MERIDIAAIRYNERIYTGARHIDILAKIYDEYREMPRAYAEGFLTSTNRFVDRREAAEIAFSAGQTRQKLEFLYSEDIY